MDGRGGGGVGGGCGGDEVRVAGGGEGEGGALEAGEVRGFGAEDGVDVGVDFELGEGCGCCWGEVSSWRRGSGERKSYLVWTPPAAVGCLSGGHPSEGPVLSPHFGGR